MLNIYTQNNNAAPITPLDGKKSKPPKAPNFMAYQDPTGEFDSKQLKRGLWFAQHEVALHRAVVIGLIIFIIVMVGYSLFGWFRFFLRDMPVDVGVMRNLGNFSDYTLQHPRFAPQAITVISTSILPGGVDKYDAVAELANLNQRWLVKFDYSFVVDGSESAAQHATLLPGEQRPVVLFGISSTAAPGSVSLNLKNVSWQRISSKIVPTPAEWQAERLQFVTDKFDFSTANTAGGASAHRIRFTLANKSSYGYAKPMFYVGLMSGDSLAGLIPLELSDFASLEIKAVDVRSFVPNVSVTDVKILPLINVYDSAVYLPPPI
ncbi:MAG: hypothetical protein EXS55_03810 [Candidatus Magasanikbacteria bacterium]|nr:hypothetical protein [Candidatus Magasanikbacteria bacterium]